MDTPQAPAAPDPMKTAQAQSQMNKETAVAQYGLNATNQVGPSGSLSYKQIGTWQDGTPRFEATTALNEGEQQVYDTNLATRQNVGAIGRDQSARIGELLGTPFKIGDATDSKIAQIQKGFLDPEWAKREQKLESDLIARGIRPGTEAYTRMKGDFSNQRSNAYDQSYLNAYNTAQKAALTERNQPINEITALMAGSQVSNPSANNVTTPTAGIAPTDFIGAQQQSLNQQNVGYQAQVANNQAMMNGLFGLGGAAAKGLTFGMF
jgi:hypothetical protein